MKKPVDSRVPLRYAAPDCATVPFLSGASFLEYSGGLEPIEEDPTSYTWD